MADKSGDSDILYESGNGGMAGESGEVGTLNELGKAGMEGESEEKVGKAGKSGKSGEAGVADKAGGKAGKAAIGRSDITVKLGNASKVAELGMLQGRYHLRIRLFFGEGWFFFGWEISVAGR